MATEPTPEFSAAVARLEELNLKFSGALRKLVAGMMRYIDSDKRKDCQTCRTNKPH